MPRGQEKPVIIEAAINGVTSKLENPKVPWSAEEIAHDAQRCFAAGAAIVHNQGTRPRSGIAVRRGRPSGRQPRCDRRIARAAKPVVISRQEIRPRMVSRRSMPS
jgi:uncharacterized protein (DUF849 family)